MRVPTTTRNGPVRICPNRVFRTRAHRPSYNCRWTGPRGLHKAIPFSANANRHTYGAANPLRRPAEGRKIEWGWISTVTSARVTTSRTSSGRKKSSQRNSAKHEVKELVHRVIDSK